jgi:DNA-binding beta-propeller fold protein YncE
MVQPQTGDIYVLTKRIDGPSMVFKLRPQFGGGAPLQAERIADLALPAVPNGLLTGGAISPDGKRVVVCDYSAGYELQVGGSRSFDDVWKQKPVTVDLGDRKQGEAVTFTPDGRSIIATSEKRNSPITEVTRTAAAK